MIFTSFIVALFLFISAPFSAIAANPTDASTSVTASVVELTLPDAGLISPPNNQATNSARITFSWSRPTPIIGSPLNHYDLYLDGTIFAANVPDSLTSQSYYFYNAYASAGIFYIALTTDITQGYHNWQVVSYNDAGTSSITDKWTFYVDSIAPTITVTYVDAQAYSSAITYYTVDTTTPTLKGTVEANSNLTISLLCPSGAPSNCSNQTYTGNYPTGIWTHQFSNIISGVNYSVYLAATDATGNSSTFPTFYLINGISQVTATVTPSTGVVTPTTTATPTPTSSPTPSTPPASPTPPTSTISGTITPTPGELPLITATLTPPPELLVIVTPTVFVPKPPSAPTPPPPKVTTTAAYYEPLKILFYLLLLLGLPAHLLMGFWGTEAPLTHLFSFLYTLGFPFLKKKTQQTLPFSSITFYQPNNLRKPWRTTTSDILGWYNLSQKLPETLFVTMIAPRKNWKNLLIKRETLLHSCLYPINKRVLSPSEKLSAKLYELRTIPLIIAILTSSIGLFIFPDLFVVTYFYLTIQYSYSEYLYPRLKSS